MFTLLGKLPHHLSPRSFITTNLLPFTPTPLSPPQVPPTYLVSLQPQHPLSVHVNDTRHSQASSHCTEWRVFTVHPHHGRSVPHSFLWLNWTVPCMHGPPVFIHPSIDSLMASPEPSSPVCHHSIASLDPSTSRASLLSTSVRPHSGCHSL